MPEVATVRRFNETGRGFTLTTGGTYDNGESAICSHWLHPSIPAVFKYDTEDANREEAETVIVREDDVQALLDAMDPDRRPIGVHGG